MQRATAIAAALLAALSAHGDVRLSPGDGTNHSYPTVCRQPDGFIAAWESDGDDGREVMVQRLDDEGRPRDAPFRANQENAGDQQLPDIACRDDGSFLLVWESRHQDGDGLGIFARDFAADGAPNGNEFQVNTFTADNQQLPRVCTGTDGRSVIVWQSFGQSENRPGIYGQRLNVDASPAGSEFSTGELVAGAQSDPALACRPDGAFAVAWTRTRDAGSQIVVKLFDSDGASVNGAVIRNDPDSIHRRHPVVAHLAEEYFAVAFEGDGTTYVGTVDIVPNVAGQSIVALATAGRDEAPAVAGRATGEILAVWTNGAVFDFALQGVRTEIFAADHRIFSAAATRDGNHGATSPFGRGIAITSAPDGYLVVWQKRDVFAADSTSAIFARRFRDCIGDCSGDGVVAINELITGVRIALNKAEVDLCSRLDANANGAVEINELIRAVNEALARICPAPTS